MSMDIRQVMTDPDLFGQQFGGDSWASWRALLAAFYALALDEAEADTFQKLTGRTEAPQEPHDELWLAIGRRGGKSQMAALTAVYEGAFRDHSARLAPGELATVMVIAADRRQARVVMRYIGGLMRSNPMLERLISREDRESIELTNRAVIEVHTASFRAVRGYTVAACICDEIAFWRSEDSANPDHEIIAAIRPSLATLDGKLVCMSSPYARRGALWDAYRRHYGKASPILVAQAPSLTMNPTLPERVVTEAQERDPTSAAAEYGAEFRKDIESFAPVEVVDACIEPGRHDLPPMSRTRYHAFADPSGGSQDSFTLAIGHSEGERLIVDAVRERVPPFSPDDVVGEFAELLKAYGVHEVTGDRYGGEWPAERFRAHGIRYHAATKPKSDLYRDMLPRLMSGQMALPDHTKLRNQIVALERRTSRGGRDSIDHGPGGHDDLANAVAGLVQAKAAKGSPVVTRRIEGLM